jgi:hypothetical protein
MDCSTQRNLSNAGRKQALAYGEALRTLGIPVQYPVLASPFWIEIYKLSANLSTAEQERILSSLRSILEIQPPLGSNKVIIAHSFPEGIGLGPIPDMGTIVVKPRGEGNGYDVIAEVKSFQ